MSLSNNTIIITGGSSGIGLEMARQFTDRNNFVIACSTSLEKLQQAQEEIPDLIIYPCDISDPGQCENFVRWIKKQYPKANMLINNAAIVHKAAFLEDDDMMSKAEKEIAVNFTAPMRLIQLLYPILIQNPKPKIINVTTGLVFVPRADYPVYNATKAALHSFTQVLREQLKTTSVKVIEVMFPAVDTPWHQGHPPKIAIPAQKAVGEMMARLESDATEIKIGGVKILSLLARIAPGFAFRKINSLR